MGFSQFAIQAIIRAFSQIRQQISEFLNICVGNLLDQSFQNNIAHTFHEFYTANNQVPASADAASRDLVMKFPDHPWDIHEHAA